MMLAAGSNPRVLLDEPLGVLGKALRIELKRNQREIGILKDGQVVEEGRPEDIYNHPKSLFAATFLVGDANILTGTWAGRMLTLGDGTSISVANGDGLQQGSEIRCAVSPERMRIIGDGDPRSDNILSGRILRRLFAGVSSTLFIDTPTGEIRVIVPNAGVQSLEDGQPVSVTWPAASTIVVV